MSMKDVLRFALTISGGPCVMTVGVQMTLEWSVLNSEYPPTQVQYSRVVVRDLSSDYIIVSPDQALSNAYFGQGSGPIFLDNVTCYGTESTLLSCNSNRIGYENCSHSEDASVRCSGMINDILMLSMQSFFIYHSLRM